MAKETNPNTHDVPYQQVDADAIRNRGESEARGIAKQHDRDLEKLDRQDPQGR
jgi:hypothetical protein